MIIKKIFFSFFILNINFFVLSQNSTLSPYSHFGFGKDLSVKTFENRQMGGVSVYADSTSFSFNSVQIIHHLTKNLIPTQHKHPLQL